MEMLPRRIGIKLNDKGMYYDDEAELNYKKKRHTLMKYLKDMEKREEELKNDINN